MGGEKSFCGHCGEAAYHRCSSCKNMTYCSAECQQAEFPFHKDLCEQWETAKQKPGSDVRRAIIFPEGDARPVFKWLQVPEGSDDRAAKELSDDTARGPAEMSNDMGVPTFDRVEGMVFPNNKQTFGPNAPSRKFHQLVCGKKGSGELVDHSTWLWMPTIDATMKPNAVLSKFVGKIIAARYPGTLAFVAMTKVEDSSWTLDLDTRDLTLALDGLVEFTKKVQLQYAYLALPKKPKKVKGIKINVIEPSITLVNVPVRHPVFLDINTIDLPLINALDHPIRAYSRPATSTKSTLLPLSGLESTIKFNYLLIDASPASIGFGSVPSTFHNNNAASMLLVNKDKETDLTVEDLKKYIKFIEKHVEPELRKAALESEKEAALAMLKKKYPDFKTACEAGSSEMLT